MAKYLTKEMEPSELAILEDPRTHYIVTRAYELLKHVYPLVPEDLLYDSLTDATIAAVKLWNPDKGKKATFATFLNSILRRFASDCNRMFMRSVVRGEAITDEQKVPLPSDGDSHTILSDTLRSFDKTWERNLPAKAYALLNALEKVARPRERHMFYLYYAHHWTMRAIGEKFGITRSRTGQIVAQVRKAVHKQLIYEETHAQRWLNSYD